MAADAAPMREPDREPPTSPAGWMPTDPAAALLPLVCVGALIASGPGKPGLTSTGSCCRARSCSSPSPHSCCCLLPGRGSCMEPHGGRSWPRPGWRPGPRRPPSRSPTPSGAGWRSRSPGSGSACCSVAECRWRWPRWPPPGWQSATPIALWIGDDAGEFFEENASRRYPLGYRNAEAVSLLRGRPVLMLVLAAARDLDWRRARVAGAATLSIELAVLSQRAHRPLRRVDRRGRAGRRPPRAAADARLHAAGDPTRDSGAPWLLDVFHGGGRVRGFDRAAAHRLRGDGSDLGGRVRARGHRRQNRPPAFARRGRLVSGASGSPSGWCSRRRRLGLARADGGPAGPSRPDR